MSLIPTYPDGGGAKGSKIVSSQLLEGEVKKIEAYCYGEDVALSAEGHEDGARPAAGAAAACHRASQVSCATRRRADADRP